MPRPHIAMRKIRDVICLSLGEVSAMLGSARLLEGGVRSVNEQLGLVAVNTRSRTHDTRGKPALPAAPNETMIGMREVALTDEQRQSEASTFAACLATILEVPLAAVPEPHPGRGRLPAG